MQVSFNNTLMLPYSIFLVRGMSDRHTGNHISEKSDTSLLSQLKTPDAWAAWTEILNRHASLIMKTASQFEYQQDRKDDCFLYVSEKLSEDGFKRLLRYRPRHNASFKAWLITVIFNLCIDWHRKEFGRATLLPAISALPAFDQFVYRLSFEQGMASEECLQVLSADFPDVTRQLLSQAISRIHRVLTPRQRWQISVRLRRRQRSGDLLMDMQHLPSPSLDPSVMAQEQQELESLQEAMKALSARQRLLLHFRYYDGLTLKQIAQIIRLGDSNRVWRHVKDALQALSDQYPSANAPKFRKK
jgi:RNA polymerase sigma factor (sigma-70 family)